MPYHNIVDLAHIKLLDEFCKLNNFIIKEIQTSKKKAWAIFSAEFAEDDYNVK